MPTKWKDIGDDGHIVSNDQTTTIRVYKASLKVRGKLASQCQRGCGQYLAEEQKRTHHCNGPRPVPRKRKDPVGIVFPPTPTKGAAKGSNAAGQNANFRKQGKKRAHGYRDDSLRRAYDEGLRSKT